ncbi:MAG: hypothetical protein WC782_11250 [Methylococcaceae bacterium]|jgi:hypothetical protein
MTEVLFILTTIFVAYVVYTVISDQSGTTNPIGQEPSHKPEDMVAVAEPTRVEAIVAVTKAMPVTPAAKKPAAKKTSRAKATVPTASPQVATAAAKPGLRNPDTGEIASSYSNYRFTKRWIKDALVAEGLLDKVYKNAELVPEVEAKIKTAVGKLEAIAKYKA